MKYVPNSGPGSKSSQSQGSESAEQILLGISLLVAVALRFDANQSLSQRGVRRRNQLANISILGIASKIVFPCIQTALERGISSREVSLVTGIHPKEVQRMLTRMAAIEKLRFSIESAERDFIQLRIPISITNIPVGPDEEKKTKPIKEHYAFLLPNSLASSLSRKHKYFQMSRGPYPDLRRFQSSETAVFDWGKPFVFLVDGVNRDALFSEDFVTIKRQIMAYETTEIAAKCDLHMLKAYRKYIVSKGSVPLFNMLEAQLGIFEKGLGIIEGAYKQVNTFLAGGPVREYLTKRLDGIRAARSFVNSLAVNLIESKNRFNEEIFRTQIYDVIEKEIRLNPLNDLDDKEMCVKHHEEWLKKHYFD